ncbi:hypothetical protein AAV95_09085 [Mycolicibacterium elephantis]|uniref:Gp19/Gp15/Gp42 family protein n=1 Tax=Mycolicibacterium elephantis TaxID=81858 RepID=UPI000629215F|nr:Gp19/Gp15/Gp42 family protein [Mycolicibacterium elephantis]KKW64985.1 hypothetical protein AAV95_09085 [Mycolicibacterium elephantis]
MAYAKATDVQTIYGKTLTLEETALVNCRLEQVERKILRTIPDLTDQIAAGAIDRDDVIDVEAEAVLRVICNPEGFFSEQDGSYGYQLSREVADNSLRVTAEELERLGIEPSRMYSIVPNLGDR